ncbi:hypothetical protein TeGR_g12380, partial [Tetraparma gracilis]
MGNRESDAVQTIVMSASDGLPLYTSLGEHDSELLITTEGGKVLRRCLGGTECNPQTRNSVMMQYGGPRLYGIGVLDETYIVVDMGDEKIYECPLTSVGISKSNCEIFAYKPQGTFWDPTNVLVDPIKRLVYDPSSPAHASLTASIVIPYAGDWTLHVTQGTYNVQHFLGSPRLITVAPGATDPASCAVEFPHGKNIVAGSTFAASLKPFDANLNPTSHPEDSFKSRVELGNSEENFGNRHVLPADHTLSELQTVAGAFKLYLYHTGTQEQVAGSPISFDVRPAPPSAVASTHNIDFDEFESSKSTDVELELRVIPFDIFNNTNPTASGFTVSIDGGDPVPLLPPSFSYTHLVPARFSGALHLDFALDGTSIANSPVTVHVAPDNTVLFLGVVLGLLVLLATVVTVYQRFCSSRIKRAEEQEVGLKESLVKSLDNKVSAQHGLQSLEGFDTASDAANAAVLVVVGSASAGVSPVLYHGLIAHGGLMVPLGLYQFIQRGRIKQGYKDILHGTDQTLLTLAKATNKAQDKGKLVELDESSLVVRLNMVNVQISSLELGIAGLLLEDAPALALNAAVLILKLGGGGEGG